MLRSSVKRGMLLLMVVATTLACSASANPVVASSYTEPYGDAGVITLNIPGGYGYQIESVKVTEDESEVVVSTEMTYSTEPQSGVLINFEHTVTLKWPVGDRVVRDVSGAEIPRQDAPN